MANKRKFTSETEKLAVEMYENGESTESLAAFFKASEETVRSVLKQHGVRLRKRRECFVHPLQILEMKKLYENGASFEEVATSVGLHWKTAHKILLAAGVRPRSAGFRKGAGHHAWRGGRHITDTGYVRIWVTQDDPFFCMAQEHGAAGGGYVLEHRLVMAKHLGRPLTDTETVHHKNNDRQNNNLDNLQLRRGKHGKGAVFQCGDCGSCNIVSAPIFDAVKH